MPSVSPRSAAPAHLARAPRPVAPPSPEPPRRTTYGHIQAYCRRELGFLPQTCWIADVLAEQGLTRRQAPNRKDPATPRKPCPPHRKAELVEAIRTLGLVMTEDAQR